MKQMIKDSYEHVKHWQVDSIAKNALNAPLDGSIDREAINLSKASATHETSRGSRGSSLLRKNVQSISSPRDN